MNGPEVADPAASFFREIVAPTVADFLSTPDSRRLGCLACLALASMADHYFHARTAPVEGHNNPDEFRRSLGAQHWGAGVVIGVANATKHVVRRPGRAGYEDVQTQSITMGNLRAGWPMNGRMVMVEVEPGNIWLLRDLVRASFDFWQKKLSLPPGKAAPEEH